MRPLPAAPAVVLHCTSACPPACAAPSLSAQYASGMVKTMRTVVAEEGAGALLTGVGATAAGYFVQG